jgi:hypothetical protein
MIADQFVCEDCESEFFAVLVTGGAWGAHDGSEDFGD